MGGGGGGGAGGGGSEIGESAQNRQILDCSPMG